MSSLPQTVYSPAEYLALERQAEYKSEYINGQIRAMSGASREHNLIAGNTFGEIRSQLRGGPCEAYVGDMRVKVSPTGMYTYPDVVAVCGERSFEDAEIDTLTNPTVVVEVLSPSTEAYDRGVKFAHYRKLASLQEYVLVAQDEVRIEHFTRSSGPGGQWMLTEMDDLAGTLHLASIGCELALRDIYDRVEFS
ncbi:MAG TPA: Uma2 family endonuclease [Chloroflexia bacterium]|nr:Uma2 family endonuclease [Chloroflexia bacterium]